MIVTDASAVADLLLERGPLGDWIARRFAVAETLHAPHHLDVEVLAVLRRREHRGEVDPWRATRGTELLRELPIVRYPIVGLVERIWSLRDNLTTYDAAYVALAEALDAPLVTTDRALARSPGHRARIETFAEE